MNKMALLREIINANNARQYSARELNRLAGKTIFPVLSDEEMRAFVITALNGATSVASINDLEALRLPPLDQDLVSQIKNSNITSMMLLGEVHYIDYVDANEPRVSIYLDARSAQLIGDLDDKGVFLPDGRQVTLHVHIGFRDELTTKEIPVLKRRLKDDVLNRIWNNWSRPPVAIPNPLDDDAVVAELVEAQWGTCPVTREALLAYGTVRSVGSHFEPVWVRDREDALQTRRQAIASLESLRSQHADSIARRRKKQEHADLATGLHAQLIALEKDMAMLPAGDKAYARVKEHLALFEEINLNKAAAAMKWAEQAREILTSGNRALVRVPNVLRAVIELLFEALLEAPSGKCQDDAFEQIDELATMVSPTLNAAAGAQKLMAIRIAIGQALDPAGPCSQMALQTVAA